MGKLFYVVCLARAGPFQNKDGVLNVVLLVQPIQNIFLCF